MRRVGWELGGRSVYRKRICQHGRHSGVWGRRWGLGTAAPLCPKPESGRMAPRRASDAPESGGHRAFLPSFTPGRPNSDVPHTKSGRRLKMSPAVPAGRPTQTPSYRTEVAQSWVFIGPVTHTGCALISGKCSSLRCLPHLGSVPQTARKVPPDPGGWLGSSFPRLRVTGGVHAS